MSTEDGPRVADTTLLYRRVHPNFVVPDEDRGCQRLSGGAFNDEEMSVHLGDVLTRIGKDPKTVVAHPYCLVSLIARVARDNGQTIVRSPTDEDESHGAVNGRKPKSVLNALKAAASWEVAPPQPCPDNG